MVFTVQLGGGQGKRFCFGELLADLDELRLALTMRLVMLSWPLEDGLDVDGGAL